MNVVWGLKEHVVPFVAQIDSLPGGFGNCQTAAVIDRKGNMVAGVVFHNWNPAAEIIEVSAASVDARWATRGVLQELFGYVFTHCQACAARTAETNRTVRRLWKAFGAQEYIIPRLRGRTASEAILMLTDEAWAASKFARPDNGKKISTAAA